MLRRENSDLFNDLPVRPLPDPITEVPGAHEGRGGILPTTSAKWLSDMDYCLELITAIEQRPAQAVKVTREGIYFAGQTFDALLSFHEIISAAKHSIRLIDGYFDEKNLKLLTAKAPGVSVEILMYPRQVSPSLQVAAADFNIQYGDLRIRTSNGFHDRFLFIDDKDFYHFGHSIKDLAKSKAFMFSKIEEQRIIDALRAQYSREWSAAPVVV